MFEKVPYKFHIEPLIVKVPIEYHHTKEDQHEHHGHEEHHDEKGDQKYHHWAQVK